MPKMASRLFDKGVKAGIGKGGQQRGRRPRLKYSQTHLLLVDCLGGERVGEGSWWGKGVGGRGGVGRRGKKHKRPMLKTYQKKG